MNGAHIRIGSWRGNRLSLGQPGGQTDPVNDALSITVGCALLLATVCMGGEGRDDETEPAPGMHRIMDSTTITEEGTRVERFQIHSPSMDRMIKAVVVLPPGYDPDGDETYPVLYTLHGANAPYDTWANMPKLRAQLRDKPFIYTCFDGDANSGYVDAPFPIRTGRRGDPDNSLKPSLFGTFFFDEFVPAIDSWYRIDPDKRGVTGFSMGGSGAFHYMLARPDFFNSVSVLSSAYMDTRNMSETRRSWLEPVLGDYDADPQPYQVIDHYLQIEARRSEGVTFPPLYTHYGTEDFLLEENRKMNAFLIEHQIEIEVHETAGNHSWKFWHPASIGVAEFHWRHFRTDQTR